MQALGYVGAPALSAEEGEALPDPKERIGDLELYRQAIRLKFQRRYAESAGQLRQLLERSPRMVDVWDLLAEVEQRLGRSEASAEALHKSLQLAPNRPERMLDMAEVLLHLGREAEAIEHMKLAASQSPGKGHLALALYELGRGRLDEARASAAQAAAALPAAGPFVAGVIEHRERRYAEALPLLREAERQTQELSGHTLRGLNYYLADILARQGQDAEAERHFLRELELFPGNYDALLKLCALYRAQERISELDGTLRRFGAENPSPQTYKVIADTYRVFGLQQQEAQWRQRAEAGAASGG
jgi:tetratricopeptide (TPR) repeat protein